jgi:hypothetical protein
MKAPKKDRDAHLPEGLVEDLERCVGASGRVQDFYGGVRITVLQPDEFPWSAVLRLLTDSSQEVWIRHQKEGMEIVSKPAGP